MILSVVMPNDVSSRKEAKNLKDILAPSKFDKQHVLAENQRPGCFSVSGNVICVIIS